MNGYIVHIQFAFCLIKAVSVELPQVARIEYRAE